MGERHRLLAVLLAVLVVAGTVVWALV